MSPIVKISRGHHAWASRMEVATVLNAWEASKTQVTRKDENKAEGIDELKGAMETFERNVTLERFSEPSKREVERSHNRH